VVQSEAFGFLRSNLAVALADVGEPTIMVTSARAGEGKTFTTAHLALSLAAAGHKVGLIDLDLRRPTLHERFEVENTAGAAEILLGTRAPNECVHHLEVDAGVGQRGSLRLLTAGQPVPQTTELLTTQLSVKLIDAMIGRVRSSAPGLTTPDIVLIDCPPVLPVADALVIARVTSGALLVVAAGVTPATAVRHARDALTRNKTRLLGVVLNAQSAEHSSTDDRYYGYGY
jgi:capsular exopolysaccharide synthesis family protein